MIFTSPFLVRVSNFYDILKFSNSSSFPMQDNCLPQSYEVLSFLSQIGMVLISKIKNNYGE